MKTNTFKFFTVLALMLTISCSVEDIQTETENANIEKNQKIKESSESQARQTQQQFHYLYEHINDIPLGTKTLTFYPEMDYLESLPFANSFPCLIEFNICYLNVMKFEFTIYSVQRNPPSEDYCSGIEKWVVNFDQYHAYISQFQSTNGGNTSNGVLNPPVPPPTSTDTDDEIPEANFIHWCFPN